MKKLPFALIVMGMLCFALYYAIGVRVKPDGTMVEAFGLIPIGYFLISLGSFLKIIAFFTSRKK